MYAKNIDVSDMDLYALEKNNKSFASSIVKQGDVESFSYLAQDMAKLRDIKTFIERDIVSELDLIGENYEKREVHIDSYLRLGELLQKTSEGSIASFKGVTKSLKSEVSALRNQKKQLFKGYENSIKEKNIKKSKELEEKIVKNSEKLTPKELKNISFSVLLNDLIPQNIALKKRINAVQENKDALIKNVKIKLESGKYINIIEK